MHCTAYNRTHDEQWLKDTTGFFLSHKKSGTEARAARHFQWCSHGPGYSHLSVLPSLARWFLSSCSVVKMATVTEVFISSPSCMQETGGIGQGMMASCLFSCPNAAWLFYTGWTPSSPLSTSYMPALLSGRTQLQGNLWDYFQQSTLSLWTKKIWGSFRKEEVGINIKQASSGVSRIMEFKYRNVFFNFLMLPFQKTDDSRKKPELSMRCYNENHLDLEFTARGETGWGLSEEKSNIARGWDFSESQWDSID